MKNHSIITPDLLVEAVNELSQDDRPVPATEVFAWCDRKGVNYQGPGLNNQAIWDADKAEAMGMHQLLKFKRGTARQSRVGWGLAARATEVREVAEREGWRELNWNGDRWEWDRDDEE